ncbi:MAG: putative sulfate exporter family transporter [Euryarchaeota archaeon]|nr:putative sulfate exporter family transporter [Euryarchaeota archaeon]
MDDLKQGYLAIRREEVLGIIVCILMAASSYIVTRGTLFENGPRILPSELFIENVVFSTLSQIGPIVLALLIGLPIAIKSLAPGASYSGKYLLRIAIALMGARVTIDVLSRASPIGIIIILLTMAFAIVSAFYLGNKWKLEQDASALIGTGNAICGVSACLTVAPVIKAKPHNLHAVIGVISILGLIGVFFVPWLATIIGLSDAQSAVLIGGSLHEVGNVVPAAEIYYNTLGGGDILGLVLAYKMIRVAMLVVVAYYLAHLFSKRAWSSGENISIRPQGFLIVFVAVAIIVSLLLTLEPQTGDAIRTSLINISASLLTIAMAGVGLAMNLRQTIHIGKRLLPLTGLIWLAQLALLLILITILV